jgi:hypothetical protein
VARAVTVDEDEGAEALARRTRGRISKRARDVEQARVDFEALADRFDDKGARLELAKIYEHHDRDPARALEQLDAGTDEDEDATARRRARLSRKREERPQVPLPIGARKR